MIIEYSVAIHESFQLLIAKKRGQHQCIFQKSRTMLCFNPILFKLRISISSFVYYVMLAGDGTWDCKDDPKVHNSKDLLHLMQYWRNQEWTWYTYTTTIALWALQFHNGTSRRGGLQWKLTLSFESPDAKNSHDHLGQIFARVTYWYTEKFLSILLTSKIDRSTRLCMRIR